MRAILCTELGEPSLLHFTDVAEIDSPKPTELLIQVKACGLNFPDLLYIAGKYQIKPPMPFSPGGEVAGTVLERGAAAEGFEVGDRVFVANGWGGLAEKIVAPAATTIKMPAKMSFETAAALSVTFGTAYHALKDRARLAKEESLLVLGASGGVGLAAVQLGKAMGAKVIAAASTPEKLDRCMQQGADETLLSGAEGFRERLKSCCNGHKIDVVLDPVGGVLADMAFRELGWAGRHLVVGFAAGEVPNMAFNIPLLKSAALVGVFFTAFRKKFPDQYRQNMQDLLAFWESGHIQPYISNTFPLEKSAEALALLAARKVLGKVVVNIDGGK